MMKPIKLKIRGLNSFIEEQIIDFEKLTEAGFFGIFGPTGSGKSTVLDGITLALYGEMARKSSNYINANCDSASVSFEFKISGSMSKRYIVEREFKTDKKTGNPRSGKCKVIDISTGEPQILAESVSGVTNACKEIIGLSLEDFTRTVVLPQGKFSEFLKLEGKSRRDMLERLFNLQQYGDNLARKLAREINKEKTENSILIGELKGYEDVSEEAKKTKEDEFNLSKSNLEKALKELENIKKLFIESEEVWNLQNELKEQYSKAELINKQENIILEKKEKIKLSEAAERVLPYVNAYENTQKEIDKIKNDLIKVNNILEILGKEKEIALENWERARKEREEKVPNLRLKQEEVKNALLEKEVVDKIENHIEKIKRYIQELEIRRLDLKDKILQLKTREEELSLQINQSETMLDTLKVHSNLKVKVQEGLRIEERIADHSKRQSELINKIEKLKKEILNANAIWRKFNESLSNSELILKGKEEELEKLISNCPGDSEALVNMKQKVLENNELWNKYNSWTNEIKTNKEDIHKLSLELEKNKILNINLEESIKILKDKIREQERENLAHKLRESLIEGEFCPVCGSTHYEKENIKYINIENTEELEKELNFKENQNKKVLQIIATSKGNISLLTNKIKSLENEISLLGEEFKKITLEELITNFNNLQKSIKEYSYKKEFLEKEIINLKNNISDLKQKAVEVKTTIYQNEKLLKEINVEKTSNSNTLESITKQYKVLKSETGIEDFVVKNKEVLEKEKEYEKLTLMIRKFRLELQGTIDNKVKLENEFNSNNEILVSYKVSISEKEKNKEEKILIIKTKVKDINNIKGELNIIERNIIEIEENFKNREDLKVKIENKYKECNEKLIEIIGTKSQLENQERTCEENVKASLNNEKFNSIEEVKENIITRRLLEEIKLEVEKHYDEKSRIQGAIETINAKLRGRSIDEEKWEIVKGERKSKEEEWDILSKETIKLEEQLNLINKKLEELGDLLKKKEKVDHKLGLLSDLEKLFKGKKFVEFVAATRLKYVSIEASKRLREITNGNYGLEVDQNGRFIIRDYKNGGVERDASTLSGGETFVASLALALALSSEIQLKGTAPLELFFLDEGFGTLDDNLLEVVMNSLERIHNDKLKIGLISHVESIKNRVPIKLILTPAVSGMGGSKVKIEKS